MFQRFLIRVQHWEYWPIYLVYIPYYIYYLILSLRAGSFFFFTASNPGIENGGMLGESKFRILERISRKPKSLLFSPEETPNQVIARMKANDLNFPVIAKPDIGERGWGVRKLTGIEDLEKYLDWVPVKFIIQDFVDLPLEAGVFYHRIPGEESGKITSIVFKEMLSVTGDGKSKLKELIFTKGRAILQFHRLEKEFSDRMDEVIADGEKVELGGIGNHALGTKFIDATDLVSFEMVRAFNELADEIDGFYFGRFDLRCRSLNDLEQGDVMIMELNGAGAEPAHIYEPGFSFFEAQKVLLRHMRIMFRISRINHKSGVPYMSFKQGLEEIRKIRDYNSTYKNG